jgi:hypothetical protein
MDYIGAHTKRVLEKTSSQHNVTIQNVYTHKVSLTEGLLDKTSPQQKYLLVKTPHTTKLVQNNY